MGIKLRLTLGVLLAVAVGSACVASSRPQSASNATVWSDRGVFVFGGIVFDIRYGHLRYGPVGELIEDCSNDDFYCLRTPTFELALPRRCRPVAVGDLWQVGDVEIRVLYHDTSGIMPRTFLGNPDRKSVVYLYERNSVLAIFWDPLGEDLVAMASDGSLERWLRNSVTVSRRAQIDHQLITYDAFGQCR